MQLAQGAPAVQVHGLDALLQVRHQHVGRLVGVLGGGPPPRRPSPHSQSRYLRMPSCYSHAAQGVKMTDSDTCWKHVATAG